MNQNFETTPVVKSGRRWRWVVRTFTFVMILATLFAVTRAQQLGQKEANSKRMVSLTKPPAKSSLPLPVMPVPQLENPPPFAPAPQDPQHQADIESIREIRATLGSSVVEGLGDLMGEHDQMDQQFTEELSRLVTSEQSRLTPLSPIDNPALGRAPNEPLRPIKNRQANAQPWASKALEPHLDRRPSFGPVVSETWNEGPDQPDLAVQTDLFEHENAPLPKRVANPYSPQIPSAQQAKISTVRAVAVQLEQAAAELEGLQLYDEADSIRSSANLMWKRARQIETHSGSPINASRFEKVHKN